MNRQPTLMKRHFFLVLGLAALLLALLLPAAVQSATPLGDGGSPEEMVQRAWRKAQAAGSYRFLSDVEQTFVPRAIPEMIGQQDTALNLALDGAVVLPDQAYIEMRVAHANRTDGVAVLRDGGRSFMLQNGELKPVEEVVNLASHADDVLAYLAAAEQVTQLDPPEGHPELARYGFVVSGPRFAEYMRQQAEAALRAEPGAPQGLSVEPLPALETLSGQGELWVNAAGFPVRQVLDLEMPEVNEQYGARIHMRVDLSGYGKVEALPQAVQGSDGAWHLEGELPGSIGQAPLAYTDVPAHPGTAMTADETAQAATTSDASVPTSAATRQLARLADALAPRVPPSSLALFVVALVMASMIRTYRRNRQLCYALIVLTVIPIMVLTPLLQAAGLLSFDERQAQAAEARAAAVPEMLDALGLEMVKTSDNPAANASTTNASAPASMTASSAPGVDTNPASGSATPRLLQENGGGEALLRCGEGEPGVDTDADGLTDQVELCLGTNPDNADSDYDAIPDKRELDGFDDLNGKHWDSDPLNADSNRDGIPDTREWASDLAEHGEAVAADLDGDGIPNLWDDDDDGDGVPDGQDLSPFALTGYTRELDLSTTGQVADGGIQMIELAIQPVDMSHLRYSTTSLDWPADELGNVQDLDNSTADLRLTPFLLVTTNVAPDATLAEKYGLRSWVDGEKTIVMAPLQPLEENGAVYAFYGKVAYTAAQTGDIQWQAKLVWMVQMQGDQWQANRLTTETRLLHQYQEPFRVTGLQVTRSEGAEAALFGTPAETDDRYLFQLFLGLGDTFLAYEKLEGQAIGETALEELYARFTTDATLTHRFGIPADTVAMTQPTSYANGDAAIAGVGSDMLPDFFERNPVYNSERYTDAEGNPVKSATLLLAMEQSQGVYDLRNFSRSDARTVDLRQLHVNLADIPVLTTRNVSLRMYEPDLSGQWQIITPARMLELVNARYAGIYDTTLAELYPNLQAQHAQFIAVTGYLWTYAGSLAAVAVDGQRLLPALADEATLALRRSMENALEGNSINYLAMATGIAQELGALYSWGQGIYDTVSDLVTRWGGMSKGGKISAVAMATLALAASTASLIMGALNTACATNPELRMCQNETAWMAANTAVKALALTAQVVATTVVVVKFALGKLDALTKSGKILGVIGLAVGIAVTWISFGFTVWLTWGDPIAWRVGLATAIVSTIWMIVLFALNFIPAIGQLIVAILSLIDAILSFFTGLFGKQEWSISKLILNLFYDAKVTSSLKTAEFGAFESGLANPNQGMVSGNVFRVEVPATGVIQKEKSGEDKDLELSYVEGDLQTRSTANGFTAQDMSPPRDCRIVGDELHCSSKAVLGYSLTPKINGAARFVARILYQTAWAEFALYGAIRYKTHTTSGVMPEDGGEPSTLYLDVLPATVGGLWNWSALRNPDEDGDGLTDKQEAALGTSAIQWDSDGDGLSDGYEWQMASEQGANPLLADSDFDGLNDGLELRLGTRINVADSDGDGLSDGEEVRRYDAASGEMVGGWQVSARNPEPFWVSSDPLAVDDDGDGLNAFEEKTNGLSPHALNSLVPGLRLRGTPASDPPDAREGFYWQPGTQVTLTVELANIAYEPVTTTLSLNLPDWLDTVVGGPMQGDRTPSVVQAGNTLTWEFTGANTLQLYEAVSTTVTARVNPDTGTVRGEIAVDLPYGDVQMHKPIQATVDDDAPAVAIVAPTEGAYLSGESYVVGGAASDPTSWVTEVSLSIVPQGSGTSFQTLAGSTSPWAYAWSLPGDGVYSLQALATDAVGNVNTTGDVTVTVDNTPPVVTLDSEMVDGTVHLSGTATDNLAGVEWMQLAIDGQSWRSVPLSGTDWSYEWTVGEGAQGDHEVRVRAIDRSGNESGVANYTITVDSVAPSSMVNRGADPEVPPAVGANTAFDLTGVADEDGHLPLPAVAADFQAGMDIFDDSTLWLGVSSIHDNDGGVLATWIGDFNADRMADLAVGLPGPDGDGGFVSVLYGRAGGWPAAPNLEMLAESGTRFSGAAGARLGSYLAAAGDTNGDNYADLLIGERDSDRAFLIFGNPGPLGGVTLEAGQTGYRTLLEAPANIEGLAAAGDVDGDGLGDLLIQAGGTAYLLLGRGNPWPETVDVAAVAVAGLDGVTGALGVGDVDDDQKAEWVAMAANQITLYGWNASAGVAEEVPPVSTADAAPRVVALGDVDDDGKADWLYSDGTSRILAYGSGGTRTFSGYDGLFAAPGDVDGDGRPDILLADAAGTAALMRQQAGESLPSAFATIESVGGAANAPYAAGADLNSDGSAELLLIPSQAAAEARGFDAPDFSSGFIAPQALPLGVSSPSAEGRTLLATEDVRSPQGLEALAQAATPDTRYVDDDAGCDGNTPCFTTIQDAVNASDGGGDTIIVYPGVYAAFSVPAGTNYDYLTVAGVSADAVFVEGGTGDAIHIAADGVSLSNLTVRNAQNGVGVVLEDGAGEPSWTGGSETSIDHLVAHSVGNAISMSQSAALALSDSTLVGNGSDPILSVDSTPNSAVHTWYEDRTMATAIGANGALVSTGGALYAMPGGADRTVYAATPGADGALGDWSAGFEVPHDMPVPTGYRDSVLAAGGDYLYQMHPRMVAPEFGLSDGEIRTMALAPNGDIYVGGRFTTIDGVSAKNIARWDGTQWHRLGTYSSNGVDHTDGTGIVYAITIISNGDVFVGGHFNQAYDETGTAIWAHHIVRWNGSQWLTLGEAVEGGNGVSGIYTNKLEYPNDLPEADVAVFALASTDDDFVLIGGRFRRVHYCATCGPMAVDSDPVWNFVIYEHGGQWDGWWPYSSIRGGVGVRDDNPSNAIYSLVWGGGVFTAPNYDPIGTGKLYVGGNFTDIGSNNLPANNVAYYQYQAQLMPGEYYWNPLGAGIATPVSDVTVVDPATDLVYAVSDDTTAAGIYQWNGSAWSTVSGASGPGSALTTDTRGNVYAAMVQSNSNGLYILPAGGTAFDQVGFETTRVWDLVSDRPGQVLAARGNSSSGRIRPWVMVEGLFRRDLSSADWGWFPYPPELGKGDAPTDLVGDDGGNVYALWGTYNAGRLYRFDAALSSWEQLASPPDNLIFANLVSAGDSLYALARSSAESGEAWSLHRYDVTSNQWAEVDADTVPLPDGANSADNLAWAWDGADALYILATSGFHRYRISADVWDNLPNPSVSFTLSQVPALTRAGNYLYTYATPGTGVTTNVFRYGAVGAPDLRLTVERTVLVQPDSASSLSWINLNSREGTYRFLIDVDNTNAWVGPSSLTWSPTLATGATTLTSLQADFVAPQNGLYRLGPDSQLTAGYHRYKAVAHVYPSQAACTPCDSTLTWGDTAFATVREAVESGAARVLVHPARYPQTFYLVSGVEVIGSGAESTIIEPPVGSSSGTLVTIEGAAGSSLARVTLAGRSGWQGFLAEGGASGMKLTRTIIRDLDTGVRLRDGSEVEIVNNTIVRNTNGFIAEGTNPANVRNTIFAYNSSAGLKRGASPTSLSNTYNDFWGNGTDMDPADVSLGSLFVDPRFRQVATDDFRLAAGSPLIDKGAPNDPTVPGGGERVDIGYAEYNAAGFYVSHDYSETGLNDGLTWGVDAFDRIQPALDAAAAAMHDLQGALPEGGYSVGVDEGTYSERVTVPSHVRLVGSGAEVTTIDGGSAGSAVTFDAVIDSELAGFTVQNASAAGAGVSLDNAASGITLSRNVIGANAGHGVSLAGSSSGEVVFNTIVNNSGVGVYATGSGTWADVGSNILVGNGTGLLAASDGVIRNDYNLLDNTTNLSGVTAGANTLEADPAFAASGHYVPSAASPAIDAADPLAEVPVAGGLRADLGYKELIASPLTLLFGPEIDSTVTGNSGVAHVEVGVVSVIDATQPVTETVPTTWQTLTPAQTGQPLFYWSQSVTQATPGLYRVYSRATDANGNAEAEELDWYEGAFVVDATAPTVSWGAPALPSSTDAAAVLAAAQVAGTVSTGTGTRDDVAQVYFTVVGPAGTTTYPAEDGRAWVSLPAAGDYTISAIAVDEAGNQAQQSATVSVSATTSVATVTEPVGGSAVSATTVALHGYVRFAGTGMGRIDVSVAGGDAVQATLADPGTAFSAWSAEITLPAGDGAKTVTVTPSIGGTAGTATILSLTLDTTAPSLEVTSPAAGTTVVRTVAFAGTASDAGSGLAQVEVSVDGGYTWRQAAISSGAWSLDWDLGLDQDHVSYPAQVRAVDLAGNVTLVERAVALDSVPPTDLAATFDQPEGQHLEVGSSLTIGWNVSADPGGPVQMLVVVDQSNATEPEPDAEVAGTSYNAALNAVSDWYVHLIARDAAGNETLAHYGPWHVRDMTNAIFSARRQSIVLDGFIDVEHDEWLAGDLLGTDAQGLETQQLYASWDGQAIYLGWSGAWWTLDGAMWAYLDVAAGGSTQPVSGAYTLPIDADVAVLIDSPETGTLYTWNGSSWAPSANLLDFSHGSSGDSEARIPYSLAAGQPVQMVAFALPPDAGDGGGTLESQDGMALLAAEEMSESTTLLAAAEDAQPWVVFPNTNPLGQDPTTAFTWSTPLVTDMNDGQPTARTVGFSVSTEQAPGTAWCPLSDIVYNILLENPEPTAISDLTITLAATAGIGYQSQDGAICTDCPAGGGTWALTVPTLGAGETHGVSVTARLVDDLSGLETVTSSISVAAGSTPLTGPTTEVITHHVDGQAPTVSIDVLAGAAIAAGEHTFTGTADDGAAGSGVARVEVSADNDASWQTASGTAAWSATVSVPSGETFTLHARAVDACGYSGAVAAQSFNVDSTAPTISWVVPAQITSAPARLSGTASDSPTGALVARVEVQVDSETARWQEAVGPHAPDSNGKQGWTWFWNAPTDDGVVHQLRARAVDQVGNTAVTEWQATLVDTVAPDVVVTGQASSIVLPDDGASSTVAGEPVLSGTAQDGSGVQAVSIRVHDPLQGVAIEAATFAAEGNWSYTPDLGGWALGAIALRVQAVDGYGNTSIQGPYLLPVQDAPIEGLTAGNDAPRMIDEPVSFEATVSHGSNVVYLWDFGDGTTGEGRVVQHVYAASGDYTAKVTATNSVSMLESTTAVTVLALSLEAGEDQTADEGTPVSIQATFTDERAGVTHTATVDWGDGTVTAGAVDENASSMWCNHAYADNGTYTVTVTVDDGGHSASDTLQVTVGNVAPTATLSNDGPRDEGSATTVSFTDVQDPGTADTHTYSFDWNNDGTYDVVDQVDAWAQHTWPDNGLYTVRGRVQDDDGGYNEYTMDVSVNNAAPAVTSDMASQTVRYSEAIAEITFTATDMKVDAMTAALNWSADGTTFQDGAPASLTVDDGSCSANAGTNICVWIVTGSVDLPAGSYTLRLTVTDKDGGATDHDVTLIVEPEEALVAFADDNPVAVQVAEAGGNSGEFTLSACVSERDVPPAGDIGLAEVSMSLVPVGPGGTVDGVAGMPTTQDGSQCVTFSFSGVPVNTYTVQVTVGGSYYAGAGEDVVVVYDPSLGFTTGGGWFYWPGTADEGTGYPGDKTNFGYTMKYNKKGTNIKGNLLLIRHLADDTIYRVKSNALYGLALGEDPDVPMGWASFSGKSTYMEPGWPEPIGNYEFTVYVEDRDEPGTAVDRFWIEVVDGLSLPREATDNAIEIGGGNVVVPHRAR